MALAAMVGMNAQAQSYPGITNPITSVYPVIFETSYRQVPLEVKITAPVKGNNLPVILISHGHEMCIRDRYNKINWHTGKLFNDGTSGVKNWAEEVIAAQ